MSVSPGLVRRSTATQRVRHGWVRNDQGTDGRTYTGPLGKHITKGAAPKSGISIMGPYGRIGSVRA